MGPLSGVRALEFGQYTAGPYCTRMLAALGAEVLKIEPRDGEVMRRLQPQVGGQGYFFHLNNADKRSVTLDITHAEARRLFRALASVSDVIVENFSSGVTGRYGIDYENARQANSRIIYCSIKGFGSSGPMASRIAYDAVVQAEAGIMASTRSGAGERPVKAGISISDLLGATVATAKIVTALFQQLLTQQGAFLDVSLYHTSGWASLLCRDMRGGPRTGGGERPPAGSSFTGFYGCFEATDGRVAIAVSSETQARGLAELADPGGTPSTASAWSLERSTQELEAAVCQWARTQTAEHVVERCARNGVPASRILGLDEAVHHPHAEAREILMPTRAGDDDLLINALPFISQRHDRRAPVPIGLPGADNRYVYGELLGLAHDELESLSEHGAI